MSKYQLLMALQKAAKSNEAQQQLYYLQHTNAAYLTINEPQIKHDSITSTAPVQCYPDNAHILQRFGISMICVDNESQHCSNRSVDEEALLTHCNCHASYTNGASRGGESMLHRARKDQRTVKNGYGAQSTQMLSAVA